MCFHVWFRMCPFIWGYVTLCFSDIGRFLLPSCQTSDYWFTLPHGTPFLPEVCIKDNKFGETADALRLEQQKCFLTQVITAVRKNKLQWFLG